MSKQRKGDAWSGGLAYEQQVLCIQDLGCWTAQFPVIALRTRGIAGAE